MNSQTAPKKSLFKRLIPLALLALVFAVVYATGWHEYFSLENLRKQRGALEIFVEEWGFLAVLLYVGVYVAVTSLSIPGAVYLTIAGGFMFGAYLGTLATVTGASIGAVAIFSAVRFGLGGSLAKSAGGFIDKMKDGFEKNAFSYLLVLRILPLFPFWLVNIVPALLKVRLTVFALATFLGIIPGSFVFNSIGEGLGTVFDKGEDLDLSIIYRPEILTPLIGLAILSLLPVFKGKIFASFERKKR